MKAETLDEPELEFAGGGTHIDIRFGLMNAGPLDVMNPRTRSISLGLVGTPQTIEGLARWLDRCRQEIPAKESPYTNLFPRFPGFNPDIAFRSTLLLENRFQRTISQRNLDRVTTAPRCNAAILAAVESFMDELRYLAEGARPDVLVCALPFELLALTSGDRAEIEESVTGAEAQRGRGPYDFHDLLKARAMSLRIPLQLVWPHTYDPAKRRRQRRNVDRPRGQQDEATRAWNLHTALYYKAGGIPWRLVRDPSQRMTCYVGISFYEDVEGDQLLTGMAQVFNERGDGVVVKGGHASISKDDRQPHLGEVGAEALLTQALTTFRREHEHYPARIVVHKTSRFSATEQLGFRAAAEKADIEVSDFLSLGASFTRVFRPGERDPLRGTFVSLDDQRHILYTRGSVEFFGLYPGMYVPLPVLFRCEDTQQTPRLLAEEILALTKMNWNTTQFDGRDPITIRGARQVGGILRYLRASDHTEPHYAFYM